MYPNRYTFQNNEIIGVKFEIYPQTGTISVLTGIEDHRGGRVWQALTDLTEIFHGRLSLIH